MWLEVETKIKVDDSEVRKTRAKIKKIGKLAKKGKKSDDYFAIQKNPQYYPKKAFRIRAMKDIFEITFKKHLKKHWTKDVVVKQEYEFTLKGKEQVEDLLELFRDLGFKEWVKKIKWNETYKWKEDSKVSIELNRVKNLGYFMELEYLAKPSEMERARNKLRKVMKQLEIKPEQIDNTGYTKMLWYKGTKGTHKFLE